MISAIGSHPTTIPDRIEVSFKEISSGEKSNATVSPAILEIGRGLLNASRLAGARNGNITNEISMNQTHDAFLQSAHDVSSRISELAVKANSGLLSASDREALQLEASELGAHMGDMLKNASFNGNKILDDSQFRDIANSLQNVDLTTQAGAEAAIDASAAAIDTLGQRRAELGSDTRALEQQFEANQQEQANLLDAGSSITGTDIAMMMTSLTSDSVLNQVAIAMDAQSLNLDASSVEALLT